VSWSRNSNTALNHDKVSIFCASTDPLVKAKSQVCASTQVGVTGSLKCSIAQPDSENRKFPPILIITEAKNPHFFVCKRTGFVLQELRDFVKTALTRVSSQWLWLESSYSVKNVTRVETPSFSTCVESSSSHQKLWLVLSHWLESRYHWESESQIWKIARTGFKNFGTGADSVSEKVTRATSIKVEPLILKTFKTPLGGTFIR